MSTRVLPNAYISLNDLSQYVEGNTSLIVGYALAAGRGPVNEATLVTSPADFLKKFTLGSRVPTDADPTFWSILNVLQHTNQMYVVRAAKAPEKPEGEEENCVKFGGVKIMAPVELGNLTSTTVTKEDNKYVYKLVISGTHSYAEGEIICVTGTKKIDGSYTVASSVQGSGSVTVTVKEPFSKDFVVGELACKVYENPIKPLTAGYKYVGSINPADDELMIVVGKDPGAYNNELAFEIVSARDSDMVYHEGADIAGSEYQYNTMRLRVKDSVTNELLEEFEFSRNDKARTIDGSSLSIENVVNNVSSYIRIVNNTNNVDTYPASISIAINGNGGSDGDEVTEEVLVKALEAFDDKTVPISILGNGCSEVAETREVQQKLLSIANTRQDLLVVLNSPVSKEAKALSGTDRAQEIVDYKKGELASTSFYGCMYAPHVNYSDTINYRQVKIGADAVAIAGWLDIISGIGYPYAYAGPRNGLVTGVTCDWKIGDESGEAALLNDASINYVAYDGKVGRYYMQCQNTLQVANSALRNIGGVLNVLDLKEHLATMLKEYINLPITDGLRSGIVSDVLNYLAPMQGNRFYNATFTDITTDSDIAQDTLRFLFAASITRYSSKIYCTVNVVNNMFSFNLLQSA